MEFRLQPGFLLAFCLSKEKPGCLNSMLWYRGQHRPEKFTARKSFAYENPSQRLFIRPSS
jgi:hypothetical protein